MKLKYILPVVLVVAAAAVPIVMVNQAGGSAAVPYWSYAVKFACGDFGKTLSANYGDTPEGPVKPGDYQTAINIHNPAATSPVLFNKKVVRVYTAGATNQPIVNAAQDLQKPPSVLSPTAILSPDYGVLIDCHDIRLLFAGTPAAPTFIEGYVILQVHSTLPAAPSSSFLQPLDVQALYTSHGYNCANSTAAATCPAPTVVTRSGFSEAVQTINATYITQ